MSSSLSRLLCLPNLLSSASLYLLSSPGQKYPKEMLCTLGVLHRCENWTSSKWSPLEVTESWLLEISFRTSPSHWYTLHIKWRQISLQYLCHFSFIVSSGKEWEKVRRSSDREELRWAPPKRHFLFSSMSKLAYFRNKTFGFSVLSQMLSVASDITLFMKTDFFFSFNWKRKAGIF